jgi:hypothetical protein
MDERELSADGPPEPDHLLAQQGIPQNPFPTADTALISSILGLCLAFSADKRHENSACRTGDPGDDRRHWPTHSYATQPAPNPDEGMAKRVCGHLPYDRRRAIAVR